MSWKPEVFVEGEWIPNGLAFETQKEALDYGKDLMSRWIAPRDKRAVESMEKVNYTFTDGVLRAREASEIVNGAGQTGSGAKTDPTS